MSVVRFKGDKLANTVVSQRDKQVLKQLKALDEIYDKCKRHIKRVNQTHSNVVSIVYNVPLLYTCQPISDYAFAMNYIMSSLCNDGFSVYHLGQNRILISKR